MSMNANSFDYNVKRGTVVSAVATLVTKVLIVIGLSATLRKKHLLYAEQHEKTSNLPFATTPSPLNELGLELTDEIVGFLIGLFSLTAIFSVMLMIAAQKNIKYLFLPWMVMIGIETGVTISFFFIQIPYMGDGVDVLVHVIGLLTAAIFNSYILWCVISHYNTLSSKSRLYKNFTMEELPLQNCTKIPVSNGRSDSTPI